MAVNVKEEDIVDKLYASTKDWVSVEVEIDRTIEPSALFRLTEQEAGDRFYMRLNDNYSSYFGYHAVQRFKNNFENKQSIFREWEKLKDEIELIHPDTSRHHLRLCGGFQFSSHKSDDEWREYGLNHFVLPKVLISNEGNVHSSLILLNVKILILKRSNNWFRISSIRKLILRKQNEVTSHVWKIFIKMIGVNSLKNPLKN